MISQQYSNKEILSRMRDVAATEMDAADELKHELIRLSKSSSIKDRKSIRQIAAENSELLILWRAWMGEKMWTIFISELYANGVGQRELDAVIKLTDEAYKRFYREIQAELYDDELVQTIKDVESFSYDSQLNILTVRVKHR